MSNPEAANTTEDPQATFAKLENAVSRALAKIAELEGEIGASQKHSGELDGLLKRFTDGGESPGELVDRVRRLEEENGQLHSRMSRGRESVERLLARIRLLEEKG